jgi:hypothetical protein
LSFLPNINQTRKHNILKLKRLVFFLVIHASLSLEREEAEVVAEQLEEGKKRRLTVIGIALVYLPV